MKVYERNEPLDCRNYCNCRDGNSEP
ncbi:hypothetical protein [Escherichia coli]